jgi:hypothetical protein
MQNRTSLLTLLVAAAACALVACGENATQSVLGAGPPPDGAVAFETIAQGHDSAYTRGADPQELTEPTLFVISDDTAWRVFWMRHTQLGLLPSEAPQIEFSASTVVAVLDGERGMATRIDIVGMTSSDGCLTVHAERTCLPWCMVTWPYHIVRVAGHGWTSAALERTDIDCGNLSSG